MTDQEAFKRFILAFGDKIPQPSKDPKYWDKVNNGYAWFKRNYPDGNYTELLERYFRAMLEITTIDHEIITKGGLDL